MTGDYIKSHIAHIFFQTFSDLLYILREEKKNIAPNKIIKYDPEITSHAFNLIKYSSAIVNILGGRFIHPITPAIGGFYYTPSKRNIESLKKYFAESFKDFWGRWHISLSTWFKDYVYIPLGGSRGNTLFKIRNVIIIFVVSGFWHGANWTFVIWGLLNGLYFLPLMLFNVNRNNMGITAQGKILPSLKETGQMLITFFITLIAWIFFRSDTVGQAFVYISNIFSASLFVIPELNKLTFVPVIIIFIIIEWVSREKKHALEIDNLPVYVRWPVYLIFGFVVLLSFNNNPNSFIYFQF